MTLFMTDNELEIFRATNKSQTHLLLNFINYLIFIMYIKCEML